MKIINKAHRIRIGKRIAEELSLPVDVISDIPRITVVGNEHVEIKSHHGVFAYAVNSIRIDTMIGLIEIIGNKLELREIDSERLLVRGNISSIVFIDG